MATNSRLKPIVSIVMPCYNSSSYIQQSIDSVKNQTYDNWELIIVNDCSTDNSKEIIKSNNDARIKFIDLDVNIGVAEVRNIAIKESQGNFIAFLDSDDLWDREKLVIQINKMLAYNLDICYSAYRKIDSASNVVAKHIPVDETEITYSKLLKHNQIGFLTAIYNVDKIGKKYFIKVGHEDFVYWLSILKQGYKAFGINQVLASYRVHSNGISANKLKSSGFTWKIYREIEKFSLQKSSLLFVQYALHATFKKLRK
jgi:glycosyltransferase involved in cell wall biosynthesis